MNDHLNKLKSLIQKGIDHVYSIAATTALTLSILAVVFVMKDKTTLNQNNREIHVLKRRMDQCESGTYPRFLQRLSKLSRKLEAVDRNVRQLIAEVKSSLESEITAVEASINNRLLELQKQVSVLSTNLNKLQTNFGRFEDLTNSKFTAVWEKFKEVEHEIAKKRKKRNKTSSINSMGNFLIQCSIIPLIVNYLV